MTPDSSSWRDLFGEPSASALKLRLRVLRKQGRDFLILPAYNSAAARAMELYPAQTAFARAARALLCGCLNLGFAPGAQSVEIAVDERASLVRFIQESGSDVMTAPFAILAGNPAASGRRYLIAVFDGKGQPLHVIKAGIEPEARKLIARESAFLKQIQARVAAAPRWRAEFETGQFHAFATEFISGESPHAAASGVVSALLSPWLDPQTTLRVDELAVWSRLGAAASDARMLEDLRSRCGAQKIHPALYHGDFAPWNIKAGPDGIWRVMDWERGELQGPPAWDWFHFITQPLLLVSQASVERCINELEQQLNSPAFQKYAAAAGIREFAREWYLAYLLFSRDVLRQTENVRRLDALLDLLRQRWRAN